MLNKSLAPEVVQDLGILCRTNKRFGEAEPPLKDIRQGFVQSLGLEHKLTLDEAMVKFRQAGKGYEKIFGPTYSATLGIVYQMGDVYNKTEYCIERLASRCPRVWTSACSSATA